MINLTTDNSEALARTIKRARERNIIIPTFKQMRDPALIPAQVTALQEFVPKGTLVPASVLFNL